MFITAQNGVDTSLAWWDRMRVRNKIQVVLEKGESPTVQTIELAKCENGIEAKALFKAINDRVADGVEKFNVIEWLVSWKSLNQDFQALVEIPE